MTIGAAVVAIVIAGAGCSSSGSGRNADGPAPDADQLDDDTFTRVTEVGEASASDRAVPPHAELPVSITEVDTEAVTVTITNHGADDVDLGDVWICEHPDCERLDEQVLAGGGSETITDPFDSSSQGGALTLARSDDPADADAILSYVEWGTTGQAGAAAAIEAGVWSGAAVGAGLVLSSGGEFATDATGWEIVRALPRGGSTPPPPPAPATTTGAPPADEPPPDDYSPPPAATTPPTPPPTTDPPPDDYSPPPPPPTAPPPPPTPPPDEY